MNNLLSALHGIWSPKTKRRANREHARKKRTKRQKRHLFFIKTYAKRRRIMLEGRYGNRSNSGVQP